MRRLRGTGLAAKLQHVGEVWWLDGLWTMTWCAPEQRLKNEWAVSLNPCILSYKVQVSFEHGVALIGIIHQQQRPHIEPDDDAYEPDVKRDWQCDQYEPAYCSYQNGGLGRILGEINENSLTHSLEEAEDCRGLPYAYNRDCHQQASEYRPRPTISLSRAICTVTLEFPGLLEFQILGNCSLEICQSFCGLAESCPEVTHTDFKVFKLRLQIDDLTANVVYGFTGFFDLITHVHAHHRSERVDARRTCRCDLIAVTHERVEFILQFESLVAAHDVPRRDQAARRYWAANSVARYGGLA